MGSLPWYVLQSFPWAAQHRSPGSLERHSRLGRSEEVIGGVVATDCRAPHNIIQILEESFENHSCPLPLSPIGSRVSPVPEPEGPSLS